MKVCASFVTNVCRVYPSFSQKPKIHLLLHLVECMEKFGPTARYNTERYTYTQKVVTCSIMYVQVPVYRFDNSAAHIPQM